MKKAGQKGIDQNIRNNGKMWTFLKDGEPIAVAVSPREGNLYWMAVRVVLPERTCVAEGSDNTLQAWHERLGHQDKHHVKKFKHDRGIKVNDDEECGLCEGCIQGKHHRLSFSSQVNKSTKPGDLVFADICGPMEENALHGFRYYVVFKDDFSSF